MEPFNLSAPAPKVRGSFDRSTPLARTLALVPTLRARFAIERIGDLTLLDRASVPVVTAIVPRSPAPISVYCGKGATAEDALVGAVMEAVERQVAAGLALPAANEVAGSEQPMLEGYDLLSLRRCTVPLAEILRPGLGETMARAPTANGLAAGNTRVEALYHALFELVERHLFSIAHARGHAAPRSFIAQLTGSHDGAWVERMVDDCVARTIAMPTSDDTIDILCTRIRAAKLDLNVVAFEIPPLPVLVVATVSERRHGGDRAHMGLGCSWSPRHAMLRAVTEAMQSRLADTSGAREDIVTADAPRRGFSLMRRATRIPTGRWYFDATKESVALSAIKDRANDDVGMDARLLVAALPESGITRLTAVDLTPPECPVCVVRVVAPELESTLVDGRIGPAIAKILAAS